MKPDENNVLKLKIPAYLNSDFVLKEKQIEKEMKEYNLINEKKYKFIEKDELIKYFTSKGEYRIGGIVLENNYPDSLILKQISGDITWPVYFNRGNVLYSRNKVIKKDNKEIEIAMSIYNKIKNKEYILLETKEYKKLIKIFNKNK